MFPQNLTAPPQNVLVPTKKNQKTRHPQFWAKISLVPGKQKNTCVFFFPASVPWRAHGNDALILAHVSLNLH
jgi:hypothetical protein